MKSGRGLSSPSPTIGSKAEWRGRPLTARVAYLGRLVVQHAQFRQVRDEIRRRVGLVIRQRKGAAMVVVAPTGAGKSTLVRSCQRMWPDKILSERTVRRVVQFSIPSQPSPRSMASALLYALGDPRHGVGSADLLTRRAHHLMHACRTRLLLIDNIQDVPERRAAQGIRQIGNWLRDLDSLKVLIVSLGAEAGMTVFDTNSQLRRRTPARFNLDYFDLADRTNSARWARFLRELDEQLPLAESSDLAEAKMAVRIWYATRGILDYVIRLMTESIAYTVRDGRERLTRNDLERGFAALFADAVPALNPFSENVEWRQLDQKGEPFYRWLENEYAR